MVRVDGDGEGTVDDSVVVRGVLGGACTLIGTSTNLVVQGMVQTWSREHAGSESVNIGLFDLGLYGVPVALAGVAYVLLASPFLLPKGARRIGGATKADQGEDEEDLLVGARVEGWSSAVGHTVAASGLRGLPGLYLVSVRRNGAVARRRSRVYSQSGRHLVLHRYGRVFRKSVRGVWSHGHHAGARRRGGGRIRRLGGASEALNDLAVHSSSSIADLQKLARARTPSTRKRRVVFTL